MSMNLDVVDLLNSARESLVSTVMRPSRMVLLCSPFVATFNARICSTSPLVVVCQRAEEDLKFLKCSLYRIGGNKEVVLF